MDLDFVPKAFPLPVAAAKPASALATRAKPVTAVNRATGKRPRPLFSDDEDSDEPTYKQLTEISYNMKIGNSAFTDVCSPVDFQDNIRKWAVKCGCVSVLEVELPGIQLPVFAYKTPLQAVKDVPMMLLKEAEWFKLVSDINQREEEIFDAKQRGLHSGSRGFPKTLLPLTISKVDFELQQGPVSFISVAFTYVVTSATGKQRSQ
jgi:hypothetical protein